MCSDSEMKMSAYADQNHAPSLTCVRLENVTIRYIRTGILFFDPDCSYRTVIRSLTDTISHCIRNFIHQDIDAVILVISFKKIRIEVFADSTSDTVISNFYFHYLQPPLTYAAAESPAKRPDGMEPCTLPPALDGSPYRLPTAISPAP